MSHQFKTARDHSSQSVFAVEPVDVQYNDRATVNQLIASKRSERAVDLAKDIHKRLHTAASEALLLDAYAARVAALLDRNLERDAKALVDMLCERYPSARERLGESNANLAARSGDLTALLAPLNNPALSSDKQAAIAQVIRREVFDLRSLADCPTLAADHPLRAAAAALHRAFEAVTGGPVAEESLSLPEISRSSPLAAWKILIRGIAAYYRHDDALCEKCAAAVEPDSAAARLVPVLRALLGQRPSLTPAAAALVQRAGANLGKLRNTLKVLDSVLSTRKPSAILPQIRAAVAACSEADPGLLERLKQHISIRAKDVELNVDAVAAALGGPSLKTAQFWRLLARSYEEAKKPLETICACCAWEEFRKHAVREGWFPPLGPEVAAVYLHMADSLLKMGPGGISGLVGRFVAGFPGLMATFYRGQPNEIRALMPKNEPADLYFLSPHSILQRACEADPCTENFQRWLRFAVEDSPTEVDEVAETWTAALPRDIPPVLHLMQSAEKRNALNKASKLMERAEQIDSLNADVRRARLRLLVSMAVRHLRAKKPHLAEKELRQIEALPQAQQGDRPAFVAALRFVLYSLTSPEKAAFVYQETVKLLGDEVVTYLLFLQIEKWCGLPRSSLGNVSKATVPLFAAFGRACAIGDEFGLNMEVLPAMSEQMMHELSAPNISVNPQSLMALGETAVRHSKFPLSYAVSGAGLAQGNQNYARFLLLRAQSIPPWEAERRSSCLAAAAELARRHHDADLLKHIGECRSESLEWLDGVGEARSAMDNYEINDIVQREVNARVFPLSEPDDDDDVDAADSMDGDCECPSCRAGRATKARSIGSTLPPELAEEMPEEMMDDLAAIMEELGPEVVLRELERIIGKGSAGKRGRRR